MSIAMLVTYEEVRPEIERLVRSHMRRKGGNWDDYYSEAVAAFAHVFRNQDDTKGGFREYLRYKVKKALLEVSRTLARRARLIPTEERELEAIPDQREKFNIDEFCGRLSRDGSTVVRLVFGPPKSFRRLGKGPHLLRAALRRHLKGMGWSRARVRETFEEVRSQL